MKLLNMGQWDREHLAGLRASFPQVEFAGARTPKEAIKEIADADAVWGHVSREVFLAAKKLRWLQHKGAGVNWMLKVPELVESDVVVTNSSGAAASTIAEHAFGMLISLARKFRSLDSAQRARVWLGYGEYKPLGLAGLTLGVLGLGKVGNAIAKRAHAFDMKVIAVDANDVPRASYISGFWRPDGLSEFLRRADVVVVCAPLTKETKAMLGASELALMKPSAYLLAVSRGGIVDEHALMCMLKEGRLAGAGLDVMQHENLLGEHAPLPANSELWEVPNLILTPHCSGKSERTIAMTKAILRDNLERFLAAMPLVNVVDKRRGY